MVLVRGAKEKRWEDNIEMDLREIDCNAGDSMDVTQEIDVGKAI